MKKKLPLFLLVVVVTCAPFFAFAAQDPANLLSGGGGGLVPQCEGAFCRACDLIELANNAINFGIAFSVIVATLMFAYAGILYVTAGGVGAEQVKKAHKVFVNVFVGLCIVLTAWLFVNILFSVLTGRGLAIWSHITCHANPTSAEFANLDQVLGGPSIINSTSNRCSAPTPTLVPIGGTDASGQPLQLADGVAQNFLRMQAAAAQAGITLRVNYAYRSDNLQYQIWTRNGCQVVNGRNSCTGIVAGPCQVGLGGSNHLLGQAVDISGCTSGGRLDWLRANASNFGFHNSLPRDLCHWSVTGG